MTRFGVHAGLQHTSTDDLRALWRRVEGLGFDWISVWDHLYAATGGADDAECLDAVAMHAALALETTRVECGCLVYSIGFRHPAVLAKAATTIDHLSGGRAAIGLGAGWLRTEYDAFGFDFPEPSVRLDQLGEGLTIVRELLHGSGVSRFDGAWFRTVDARCEPPPAHRIPIWVGGGGERRTLRLAATYADGWNVPFVDPTTFARKRDVLLRHCDDIGRDPAEVRCAVNVGLAWTDESRRSQFGKIADAVAPGVLGGSVGAVVERIGEYVAAGADQVNLALRAPFDHDALAQFSVALALA